MKNYQIYFLNILASSLFYSFVTTKLALLSYHNPLMIVSLSALVSLMIFGDLKYLHFFEKFSLRALNATGMFIGILLLGLSFQIQQPRLYLWAYFLTALVIAMINLMFENSILKEEISLSSGFLNMQLLRTIATLVGFFLGATLSLFQDFSFLLIFIFVMAVNLFNSWQLEEPSSSTEPSLERTEKIKGWQYFIILGILATTVTLWIPLLVSEYVQDGFSQWASVPFLLPGIVTLVVLQAQKALLKKTNTFAIELLFILTAFLFVFFYLQDGSLLLQVILFSFLTAFSSSLIVTLRRVILQLNRENNQKYLLQTTSLVVAGGHLFFSLVGNYFVALQIGLLFLNLFSVFYMIVRRKSGDEIWDLL